VNAPRHFLDIGDLTPEELHQVLDLAELEPKALGRPLAGATVPLIFEKPSNRTRQSMVTAVVQLGGHPVYTRGEEIGLDVRESVEDVTHVMVGYHAMLCARVFEHHKVQRMAAVATVPVVNMLSDWSHPLQGLADVLTMRQNLGPLAGRTVAYVGDYNNVARSLGEASAMLGMHIRFGCPPGYQAADGELERLVLLGAASAEQYVRAAEAVRGADAVHTDTWTSMGQEQEKAERVKVFEGHRVTTDLMAQAADHAIFMHCLPAYRGYEVHADVIDGPASRVYQQSHNRLHASRGVLAFLLRR
jgi:ornithine carbamoyltransferase